MLRTDQLMAVVLSAKHHDRRMATLKKHRKRMNRGHDWDAAPFDLGWFLPYLTDIKVVASGRISPQPEQHEQAAEPQTASDPQQRQASESQHRKHVSAAAAAELWPELEGKQRIISMQHV